MSGRYYVQTFARNNARQIKASTWDEALRAAEAAVAEGHCVTVLGADFDYGGGDDGRGLTMDGLTEAERDALEERGIA